MEEIFKKLTDFIKKADNVIIMTHKNIDLDALGSAMCLARIISDFKVENYLVLNQKGNNHSVNNTLQLVEKSKFDVNIVDIKKVLKKITNKSLLIILDTSKKELVEYPELLDLIEDKVVIDHHVLGNKNIQATKLSYVNENISSTSEIIVKYLKFLKRDVDPLMATIMLAGMEVDTNSYNAKTSADTFYAAAFLLEQGALNVLKKEILKEDKQSYLKREKYLENSYIVKEKFAICRVNDIIAKEDLSVIAERMLLFDQVEASFAIGVIDGNIVAISARSLGQINVYNIMKKFNGGGHFTDAAAQINDKSIMKVEKELLKAIEVI